jgi:16S rRNA processing protein RimM
MKIPKYSFRDFYLTRSNSKCKSENSKNTFAFYIFTFDLLNMNDYIHIGRIVASFGLKGEVILKHALGKRTVLKDVEAIFIEQTKGAYLPYFVESSKAKDHEETYVKLETVDTKESANRLTTKNVWLADEDFRKLAGKTAPISLLGFQLISEEGNLGPIEEVIEQPHQVLLRINLDGKEALIPLHAETLDKIDHKKKEVHVILPDGLLDIYR